MHERTSRAFKLGGSNGARRRRGNDTTVAMAAVDEFPPADTVPAAPVAPSCPCSSSNPTFLVAVSPVACGTARGAIETEAAAATPPAAAAAAAGVRSNLRRRNGPEGGIVGKARGESDASCDALAAAICRPRRRRPRWPPGLLLYVSLGSLFLLGDWGESGVDGSERGDEGGDGRGDRSTTSQTGGKGGVVSREVLQAWQTDLVDGNLRKR